MRCIVSDLLAKCDEDATVRARMESYQHWDALHKLMLDVKDAKVNSIRHKRRRGEGEEAEDGDVALPVSPLSPRTASTPKEAAVWIMVSSSAPTYQRRSRLYCLRSSTGYATSWPGPWYVTLPPRSDCTTSAPAAAIASREAMML